MLFLLRVLVWLVRLRLIRLCRIAFAFAVCLLAATMVAAVAWLGDHDAVLRPDTEAATTDQMLTLVKSELGLAFVPEPMAREPLQRGEIVQLHLQEIIPSRSICLVYDHHRPLNTAARKFQQMITQTTARHA